VFDVKSLLCVVLLPLGLLILVVGFHFWIIRCSDRAVRDWARSGGLRLMRVRSPLIGTGPFNFEGMSFSTVYLVSVITPAGEQKDCWLRLRRVLSGYRPHTTDVVWIDPQ